MALSGPHAGRRLTVTDTVSIGRAPTSSLVLDDPKVSRRHAVLWRADDALVVMDEGSLNGTWVNDARIHDERRLHVGDRVRVGGSEFVVRAGQQASREDVADVVDAARPRAVDVPTTVGAAR